MIFDFTEYRPDGHYDICVVGSGPAGMALALKLARGNKRVLLLEGGAAESTQRSQDIYRGGITGDPYYPLHTARLRFLGGTSNHWSGWCRPLDAYDFEPKPYRPLASWPISKFDLDPYSDEARAILGIGEFAEGRRLSESILEAEFNVAPVRFAATYGDDLRQSTYVHVYLNANVTALRTDGSRIAEVEVTTWTGQKINANADTYVLATGGIENCRLLLWSNELANGALVAPGAPVGRYWMDTPAVTIGQLVATGENAFREMESHVFFSPTREALIEDESLSCGLYLVPADYSGARELIADLACVAPETARRAARWLGRDLVCGYELHAAWAQEPQAASRIELSGERDPFGVPRVNLHWQRSGYDIRTARKAVERLARYLAEQDLARVHLDGWVTEEKEFPQEYPIGMYHHMGGTRMATSPAMGVVDEDCRVFGQDNLYIAGSSVFPAAGHVNPTFTILQLALRLGDHLLRA